MLPSESLCVRLTWRPVFSGSLPLPPLVFLLGCRIPRSPPRAVLFLVMPHHMAFRRDLDRETTGEVICDGSGHISWQPCTEYPVEALGPHREDGASTDQSLGQSLGVVCSREVVRLFVLLVDNTHRHAHSYEPPPPPPLLSLLLLLPRLLFVASHVC